VEESLAQNVLYRVFTLDVKKSNSVRASGSAVDDPHASKNTVSAVFSPACF
jgi:hypothetical protein